MAVMETGLRSKYNSEQIVDFDYKVFTLEHVGGIYFI